MSIPLLPGDPPELLVLDQPSRCPYLSGRLARMPLRMPVAELTRTQLDQRLEEGDRRQGLVLYRTRCPECNACEPIRVRVSEFVPGRTLRRIERRGDRELRWEIGRPTADARRVELYNRHKQERGLADSASPITVEDYVEFLVATVCESFEIRYYAGDLLVGVAITDRGERGLSAVYCYFDPDYSALSIGTYSILKQLELCRRFGIEMLYLGLYIEECANMRYKARFLPHERRLDGRWVRFEAPAAASRASHPPQRRA